MQKDLQEIAQHILVQHFSTELKHSFSDQTSTSTLEHPNADVGQKSSIFRSMFSSAPKLTSSQGLDAESAKLSPASKSSSWNKNMSNNNNNALNYLRSSQSPTNQNLSRNSTFELSDESLLSDAGTRYFVLKVFLFNYHHHLDSNSSMSDSHKSPRSQAKWSESEFSGCDILEPIVCSSDKGINELHFYVLNHNSLVFPMLKTSWRDYLLVGLSLSVS